MEESNINLFLAESTFFDKDSQFFLALFRNEKGRFRYYFFSVAHDEVFRLNIYQVRNIFMFLENFEIGLIEVSKESNVYGVLSEKLNLVIREMKVKKEQIMNQGIEFSQQIVMGREESYLDYDLLADKSVDALQQNTMGKYLVKVFDSKQVKIKR